MAAAQAENSSTAVSSQPQHISWNGVEYVLGTAPVGDSGEILVAMPLPKPVSLRPGSSWNSASNDTLSWRGRAAQCAGLIWCCCGGSRVWCYSPACGWRSTFPVSTRPVVALAEATQEISRGNLDYRVEVPAADELGDLVRRSMRWRESFSATGANWKLPAMNWSAPIPSSNAEGDTSRRSSRAFPPACFRWTQTPRPSRESGAPADAPALRKAARYIHPDRRGFT